MCRTEYWRGESWTELICRGFPLVFSRILRAHVWEETILVQGKNHLKGLEGQWPVRQHEGEIKKFSDIKKKKERIHHPEHLHTCYRSPSG